MKNTGRRGILSILNELLSQSIILSIDDRRFIVKNYNSEQGLIKWFLIKTAGLTTKVYPYTMDPRERMMREIVFLEDIRRVVDAPRIVLKDWIGRVIVREYVEGEPFTPSTNYEEYREIGEILAQIHLYGYTMGDSKYYNFVKKEEKYYVIDGEQAVKTSDYAYMYWDIFVFLTTVIYGLMDKYWNKALKHVGKALKSFLEGYVEYDRSHGFRVLRNYRKFNYRALTYMLLPIPYNIQYVKVIESLI